ncbi:defensin-2-like [Nylanderia fulva]|uniref:defensin-2-like n=1 Tax=Nylanderia fulva TaxID=613905 RepID=UPI0010FB4BA1|nr:defensin-2-like [Nylanderia fulva]
MKLLAILAIFAVVASVLANTLPAVYDGPTYELTAIDDPGYDEPTSNNLSPIRHRRITCDLLSWQSKWPTVDHRCAVKCLSQRRQGGRCQDGICVCRN